MSRREVDPIPTAAGSGPEDVLWPPRPHPHHPVATGLSVGSPHRGAVRDEMDFLALLGESMLVAGRLSAAGRLASHALDREADVPGEVALGPHYVWGAVLAERNHAAGAAASLEVAVQRADGAGAVCCRVLPRLEQSRLLHAAGDAGPASAVLADVEARYGGWPLVDGWVAETRANQALREGDPDGAEAVLDALDDVSRQRVLARVHAARGDSHAASTALAYDPSHSTRAGLDSLLVRARCAGDEQEQDRLLAAALALAEPDEYVRRFTDEASWLHPPLLRVDAAIRTPYASKVLAAVAVAGRAGQPHPATRYVELTPREAEVLGYLETRLSLEEIARELFVSRNTVKSHVRSIYAKLGVRDRAEARRWLGGMGD